MKSNALQINIPRTRNGEFKPITMELLKKGKEEINNLTLTLYKKGMSTRDIEQVLDEYFGESMSIGTISNLSKSFGEIREAWSNTKLDSHYKAIFCDGIYVNVKRNNSYSKEVVYVAYGVKEDNTREQVLLEVNPTESATNWEDFLTTLKVKRGVEKVDLFIADGLTGFADAAKKVFPDAGTFKGVSFI